MGRPKDIARVRTDIRPEFRGPRVQTFKMHNFVMPGRAPASTF